MASYISATTMGSPSRPQHEILLDDGGSGGGGGGGTGPLETEPPMEEACPPAPSSPMTAPARGPTSAATAAAVASTAVPAVWRSRVAQWCCAVIDSVGADCGAVHRCMGLLDRYLEGKAARGGGGGWDPSSYQVAAMASLLLALRVPGTGGSGGGVSSGGGLAIEHMLQMRRGSDVTSDRLLGTLWDILDTLGAGAVRRICCRRRPSRACACASGPAAGSGSRPGRALPSSAPALIPPQEDEDKEDLGGVGRPGPGPGPGPVPRPPAGRRSGLTASSAVVSFDDLRKAASPDCDGDENPNQNQNDERNPNQHETEDAASMTAPGLPETEGLHAL